MKKTRINFTPSIGQVYANEGGGTYECIKINSNGLPTMRNVASGWTLIAHGIAIYDDGKIDWDYSTGGHFAE